MPHENETLADTQFDSLVPPARLDRRGFFLGSGAALGFALAAGPLNAQQVIQTPATGLDTADLKIPTSDGREMPGYLAAPAANRRNATVIVVPEVFGMHEYQKDICRRLAKLGYTAATLDPFFRFGDLAKMPNINDVLANANKLDDARMLADMDSLAAVLDKHPKASTAKLGITGMCRGGRTVWMYTAHNPKIKAGVSWYGGIHAMPPNGPGRGPIEAARELKAPVLGLYAGADAGIPTNLVAAMQESLKQGNAASKASTFVLYPGMPHGFHADYRPTYRKEAAEDGWRRMLAWFKANGV